MKSIKKVFALLLAFAMTMGMATTVFAAERTSDTTISVTELTEGDVVTYYQVIEWKDNRWQFKAPFDSLSEDDLTEIVGTPEIEDDPTTDADESQPAVQGQITYAMARKIAAAATSGGTTDPAQTSTTWSKGTDADPVAAGLYMITIAAAESGVVYNPVFVGADFSKANSTNTIAIGSAAYLPVDDKAVAKKSKSTIVKTESDTDQAIQMAIDSKVGETVTFNYETTIPVYLPTFKAPEFKITDKIVTGGVELDFNSITVTLDPTADPSVYTITPSGTDGYTIEFDTDYLKENVVPVEVKVEYEGKLTNAAEFNINREENDVTVEYTNGPNNEKGAMKDITNIYTFSLGAKLLGDSEKKTSEIVKVAVDENGEYITETIELSNEKEIGALPGAVFGLYTDEKCTTLYTNDLTDGKFTTGADGVITYQGLAAGTYWLKEISAPEGYIKDQNPHKVVITAEYNPAVEVTETDPNTNITVKYDYVTLKSYTVTVDGQSNTYEITNEGPREVSTTINQESFEVKNTQGVELPSTGGIGTTLFYVIGTLLVLGAGVVLVTKRRIDA